MLLLSTAACDNTIEPFSGEATYSIYGYLSLSRQRQFIRVKSLTTPLSEGGSRTLDATVTLDNLATGTSTILQDSVVVFDDAESRIVTHNFWTETPVTPDTRYRVTVEGPDGTLTQAETTTPTPTDVIVTRGNGDCLSTYTVAFPEIEDDRRLRAFVEFDVGGQRFRYRQADMVHGVGPDGAFLRFRPEGLLGDSFESIDDPETECFFETLCSKLSSKKITISFTQLGPDWFGEVPDDEFTLDPMSSPDVTNGSGFFGSLVRSNHSTSVDTSDTIRLEGPECP